MTIFMFSIPVFLVYLMEIKTEKPLGKLVVAAMTEVTFLSLAYLVLLFSFVVPIILGLIGTAIVDYFANEVIGIQKSYSSTYGMTAPPPPYFNPVEILFTLFFGGLGIIILISLTSAPYLLLVATTRFFAKMQKGLTDSLGSIKANRFLLVVGLSWLVLFGITSYQPNPDKYVEKLQLLSEAESFDEKQKLAAELMPEEAKIRRAFDDLQNVRQRYLMAKSDDSIKEAYMEVLNFGDASADIVQKSFHTLAYPFVYQGSLDNTGQALASFRYLFGEAGYQSTQGQTANVNVVSKEVQVTTDYDGYLAKVVTTEEYTNKTSRDQEVIYEFSLPRDSVVTDLKLGPDLEFSGVIAPKGAATRTFERELVQRRDPALLEQTGPTQYRLRVFPIPGTTNRILNDRNQKVQFTYVTTINFEGFGLPLYSREQNVKVDKVSYSINGQPVEKEGNFVRNSEVAETIEELCVKKDNFTSRSLVASGSAFLVPNISQENLAGKYSCSGEGLSLANAAEDLNIAVLFDVSYLNKDNDKEREVVNFLKDNPNFLSNNTIGLYKFNDALSSAILLTPENADDVLDFTFFGTSDWIKSVGSLSQTHDFVVLLTNENEPPPRTTLGVKKDFPIYIVHTQEAPAYTTAMTGELIQSGSEVFTDFYEALNTGLSNALVSRVDDGRELISASSLFSYYTNQSVDSLLNTSWTDIRTEDDPLAKLTAKKLSDLKIEKQVGALENQISFLDTLNQFAQSNSVVTPFSSLIALVNERQLQTLELEAQRLDRYKDVSQPTPFGRVTSPALDGAINIGPGGQFSELSGGPFGALGGAGMTAFDGGGGPGVSALSLFIIANILILGGGITFFIVVKVAKSFRRNEK